MRLGPILVIPHPGEPKLLLNGRPHGTTGRLPSETITQASQPALRKVTKLETFEETILPHLNAAYNLARWLLHNQQDAQDAVQEASLRAYRFFNGYRGGDAKAWLLAIVRNVCLSWRQRAQRDSANVLFDEVAHSGAASSPDAEERLLNADEIAALRSCMEALPAEYREVLVLREFEDMPYKQIAETIGLALGTVMSRLARARQRLQDCVGTRIGVKR